MITTLGLILATINLTHTIEGRLTAALCISSLTFLILFPI